jgi:hypothetical protein
MENGLNTAYRVRAVQNFIADLRGTQAAPIVARMFDCTRTS